MKRIDTVDRNIYYRCLEYDYEQLGELFLIACGMENCDPGAITGPDIREAYHLHVVRSGRGILRAGGRLQFYDCLTHQDLGIFRESFSVDIPSHGCRVYRVKACT